MNSIFLCKSLSRTAYCFKDASFSSVPGMKETRTRMDMIQYSNMRDYRQTTEARSNAELSEVATTFGNQVDRLLTKRGRSL
jgi:hypothetical protein